MKTSILTANNKDDDADDDNNDGLKRKNYSKRNNDLAIAYSKSVAVS